MEDLKNIEGVPRALELAVKLEGLEDISPTQVSELLEAMQHEIGVAITNNTNLFYRTMREKDCLVRVETLSRVLSVIELGQKALISEETDNHYANAVIPENDGIKIAFSEGWAPGPVRTAVAFGKTIVGFITENIDVKEIDFDPDDPRGAEERKYLCRHVDGYLTKNDIVSVVMRIPRRLIEDKFLFPDEVGGTNQFIFRGFVFND